MARVVQFLKASDVSPWIPPEGVVTIKEIHLIAQGGKGFSGAGEQRAGGGAGAWGLITNFAVTPGQGVPFAVGVTGAAQVGSTWWSVAATYGVEGGYNGSKGGVARGGSAVGSGIERSNAGGGSGFSTKGAGSGGGGAGGPDGPGGAGGLWGTSGNSIGSGGGGANGGTAGSTGAAGGAAGGVGNAGGGNGGRGGGNTVALPATSGQAGSIWTSTITGEVAGPGGGAGGRSLSTQTNQVSGGNYGGGGGGSPIATDPNLGGDGLIVLIFDTPDAVVEKIYKGAGTRATRYLGTRSDAALYLGAKVLF